MSSPRDAGHGGEHPADGRYPRPADLDFRGPNDAVGGGG